MAENGYKPPPDRILRHRKQFYSLWRRCDDESASWLKRIQNQIDRCEFPPLISCEYLLIDKFICELNTNAREFIQSVDTWTLAQLHEYFIAQNIVADHRVNVNISIDSSTDQQIPPATPGNGVKSEFVSASQCICV